MDNLDVVWQKFHRKRTVDLFGRFPGWYRAEVVETNDPLQHHRVRFKCPELHDHNLKPEDCPWADKAPWLGGKNAGSWVHPMIGDIVWITWEKNHPYGPIWSGFATGTRRKRYPLESMYTMSPLAVKLDGTADEQPVEFLKEYLPKDFRPMSHGWRDRYGNYNLNSSVGFFPIEHEEDPSPVGQDAVGKQKKDFATGDAPQVNKPDRKYLASVTKYGHFQISSDVGYFWKKTEEGKETSDNEDLGEFLGDFDKDREFEIKRYQYLTKFANEQEPESDKKDQRRYEVRTRAGHKLEMRDVGWAQMAGGRAGCNDAGKTKSRPGEYGEPRVLSKWFASDERWIKHRTKGGHLIQAMDMGFHPEKDNFYKRLLSEEHGSDPDGEFEHDWTKRDARQIRIVTRWGLKFVLDDRGTHTEKAEKEELPRGNGWLLKSRRSWESEPSFAGRGFGFECNDKDELNTTRWYSPKSKIMEMNDREDYTMICTDTKSEISREWMKLKENEFALKVAMTENPESDTYHLKLDKQHGYLRLKTAAGGDNGRRTEPKGLSTADSGLNQGLEARDGRFGSDGAWTEVVDIEHRGIWFSKNEKIGIWRGKKDKDQFIMINDGDNSIVIRNAEDGPIQLFCNGDIELISKRNIVFKAGKKISFKAGNSIEFQAGSGGHAQLTSQAWTMDVPDNAPSHNGRLPGAASGSGAQSDTGGKSDVIDPKEIKQEKREPEDRAEVLSKPEEIDEKIITGCSPGGGNNGAPSTPPPSTPPPSTPSLQPPPLPVDDGLGDEPGEEF